MTKTPTTSKPRDDQGGDGPRIVSLLLDRIQIRDRRESNEDAINDLAVSMRDIGLIYPINVAVSGKNESGKNMYSVYGGTNRCKAALKLGWKRINAIVLTGDEDELRLYEIAENIFRNDPTVLECAELTTEYVEIVNRKAVHDAHPGGQQPHDKGISQAAKKLHITREKVRRSQLISGISQPAKDAIKEAKLSDTQKYLLEIAKKKTPEDQLATVAEVAKRKARPPTTKKSDDEKLAEALAINVRDGDFEMLKHEWARVPQFAAAWSSASELGRELFIKEVLRTAPPSSPAKTEKDNGNE